MPSEITEQHAYANGILQRLDPRLKIAVTLAFVLAIVLTPIGYWRPLVVEGLILTFVVGLSRVEPGLLARRWFGFVLLVGFLAATVAHSHPSRVILGWPAVFGTILAKNSLAFVAVLTLAATTPFPRLLDGLKRLGMPVVLVSTLHFMSRYHYVLISELSRMTQARRSRTFRRSGRLDWGLLTGLIGNLFVRSFERGERVHAAMLARGWDGSIRSLDGYEVDSR